MPDLNQLIDFLGENLGHLQTAEGDTINMVPFLHDSDLARKMRRDVAEGIALLLDHHGYLKPQVVDDEGRIVHITCAQCSGQILSINTARPQNGRLIINQMAHRDPSCSTQHQRLTPEVMIQRLQESIDEAGDTI